MRKCLSVCCLAALLIISCSKSGINNTGLNGIPRMDSILVGNLVAPLPYQGLYLDPTNSYLGKVYFTYDHSGRVTKRVDNRPFGEYDTVIYKSAEDIILIYKSNSPYYIAQPTKREIIFKGGYIKWKLYYLVDLTYGTTRTDTIEYFHNAQGRLSKTIGYNEYSNMENNFYYSNTGNLDSVFSFFRIKKTGVIDHSITERFNYDNKANPLKGNCLWDDLLYRSLSNNNFNSYSYWYGRVLQGGADWSLHYKPNGEVDFSK